MALENAFELAASSIRFGKGVTREIGMDLAEMKARRVMVLTDQNLARLQPVATVVESLRENHISFELFDRVRVEPTTSPSARPSTSPRRESSTPSWRWAAAPPSTPPRRPT